MKPMQPSEHLSKIVGTEPLPRSEVTKKIWAYIKKHSLQNPKNKREILADEKLQPIFGTKKLDMFQMANAVKKHWKSMGWRVRAFTTRCAEAPAGSVFPDKNFLCYKPFPNGSMPL